MKITKKISHTVIIGCGRLGSSIANQLSENHEEVTIIDAQKEAFRKLSPAFGGLSIEGDGSNLNLLEEVQLETCDVLVVVTNNDNSNILIAQLVREQFPDMRIIVRLFDSDKACVYEGSGIETICPVLLSVKDMMGKLKEETV